MLRIEACGLVETVNNERSSIDRGFLAKDEKFLYTPNLAIPKFNSRATS